jgi:hypothetical protein
MKMKSRNADHGCDPVGLEHLGHLGKPKAIRAGHNTDELRGSKLLGTQYPVGRQLSKAEMAAKAQKPMAEPSKVQDKGLLNTEARKQMSQIE